MRTESRQSLIFWFTACTTAVSFAALCVCVAADAYVRWNINQDFTFLGDTGLLALAVAFTGQAAALVVAYRPAR